MCEHLSCARHCSFFPFARKHRGPPLLGEVSQRDGACPQPEERGAPLTASIFGAGTKGKIFLAFIPNPAVLENMNNYRGTLRSKINPQATLVSFGEYGSLFILSVKSYDDLAIIRNILNIRLCDINHKEKDVTLTGRGGGQIPR